VPARLPGLLARVGAGTVGPDKPGDDGKRARRATAVVASGIGLLAALAAAAAADDMASFAVVLHDGTISPDRLEVPANRPFKLEISNTGSTPAEFESLSLHKEKVLSAGVTSGMVIRRLEPGEYDFFDDFHPGSKAVLVAREDAP
jgi:hypothetical protein